MGRNNGGMARAHPFSHLQTMVPMLGCRPRRDCLKLLGSWLRPRSVLCEKREPVSQGRWEGIAGTPGSPFTQRALLAPVKPFQPLRARWTATRLGFGGTRDSEMAYPCKPEADTGLSASFHRMQVGCVARQASTQVPNTHTRCGDLGHSSSCGQPKGTEHACEQSLRFPLGPSPLVSPVLPAHPESWPMRC